jgi:two-component system response regulator FixJ
VGGAEDFLEKRASKEKLLDAVNRALARDMREREERARQGELCARFAALTKRELEVLGHVVLGRLNKQIAADLCIHERTVKLHRTAITTKLRVQSVAELTRLTDEAGIFTASTPTFPLRAVVGNRVDAYSARWIADKQNYTHLRRRHR